MSSNDCMSICSVSRCPTNAISAACIFLGSVKMSASARDRCCSNLFMGVDELGIHRLGISVCRYFSLRCRNASRSGNLGTKGRALLPSLRHFCSISRSTRWQRTCMCSISHSQSRSSSGTLVPLNAKCPANCPSNSLMRF